jgi:hypothetical protein
MLKIFWAPDGFKTVPDLLSGLKKLKSEKQVEQLFSNVVEIEHQ